MIKISLWKILLSLVSISYSFCLLASYETLDLALMLQVPQYKDFDDLVTMVQDQSKQENKEIFTRVAKQEDLHMTLLYPFIPLDEEVIQLFPRIKKVVEKLCAEKRAQAYKERIPDALSKWLTPRVRRWFMMADRWNYPIVLPFLKLQQLGRFLTAEFALDQDGRLMHVIERIKTRLRAQFSKITFAYDTLRPHISLGVLNPLFDVNNLVQPMQPLASLFISRALARNIVVSVRMKKEKNLSS